MKVKVLAFAKAKDDFGFSEKEVEADEGETPREMMARIAPGRSLEGLRVALDLEFGGWDIPMGRVKEISLLPPVSGG